MSEKDLNTGLSDCIWMYDDYYGRHETACGSVFFSLLLIPIDENGNRYCPKCDKQIRCESK